MEVSNSRLFGVTPIHYMEKNHGMFSSKTFFFLTEERKKDMNIFDDMGVSKLSGNFYSGSEHL